MNTARQSLYKNTSHPIGANTENIAFNLPDKAAEILKGIAKSNRSQFIREAVAHEITRINRWTGIAFRAAINLKVAIFKSIHAPLPPAELQPILEQDLEAQKAEQQEPKPNDKLAEDSISEFADDRNFVPKKARLKKPESIISKESKEGAK